MIHTFSWEYHLGYFSRDHILFSYDFHISISLIWYFYFSFICIDTLSWLLLARELCARFVWNYMRLHYHSEQNDSLCLPHNLLWGFINSPPFSLWLHSQNTGMTDTYNLFNKTFLLSDWTWSIKWCLFISSVSIPWDTTLASLGSDSPASSC